MISTRMNVTFARARIFALLMARLGGGARTMVDPFAECPLRSPIIRLHSLLT